ncbi:hypothetical protein DSM100688_1892 [Bifidobacterium ramosum]|uniref:Uncharacterized protein n=1 Tax=Bifidobacterium ramosum TaxID=1798158 RepID=A0A6L4WYN2_9BIFI|nr:hypothetical protein [Bifidobacterium ramosum]KAB8287117.1 hypothetical protein DSM100688_1892 [Bifidobacterium ramosum]NEG71820.1 hypothetical protein [Bifidobacterium ramosum]
MTTETMVIDVRPYTQATQLEHEFRNINHRYGTDFSLHRFRMPIRRPDGEWDCMFQLPVLTYRYGEVEHEHGLPDYRMFDLRYLRAWLADDCFPSYTELEASIVEDNPINRSAAKLSISGMGWVLGLEDAHHARLLTELDADEPTVTGLYAAVERKTGLVYPMATGTRMTVTRDRDDDHRNQWKLTIAVGLPPEQTLRWPSPYDDYFGKDCPDERTMRDQLERDLDLLREQVLARDSDRCRIVRQAAESLCREYAATQDKEER